MSSILESGNGLFNTHVTLEDVENVIQEQMKTKSQLGKGTKLSLYAEGNGIMSRIILIEPEWTIPSDHLPSKFILKIPYLIHVHGMIEKMLESSGMSKEQEAGLCAMFEIEAQGTHNREINMYKIMEKWNKKQVMLNPKLYFSNSFDSENKNQGFMGMEFAEGADVRHLYHNVKPDELYPVLKSVAHLQAGSLDLTDEELKSITGFDFMKMVGPLLGEDGVKSMLQQANAINPQRFSEKISKIQEFGQEIINLELIINMNKYVGIKQPVLVHGDLWAPNVLWTKTNGIHKVDRIIDYQGIHMGNPAEDLVRLFVSTLSGKDRQNNWEKLLFQFYKYFQEALGNGQKAPYTLDQLKESYRYYFVLGSLALLPMFGHIAQAKLPFETENLAEFTENMMEKLECLMEDVLGWHLYSKDVTKKSE